MQYIQGALGAKASVNGVIPSSISVVQFNGASHVDCPSSAQPTGAQTMAMWINAASWPTAAPLFGGGNPYSDGGANNGAELSYTPGGSAYYQIGNTVTGKYISFPSLISDKYMDICGGRLRQTANPNSMKAYVNGAQVGSGTGLATAMAWGTDSFLIGSDKYGRGFNGIITDFQVYNGLLSAAQVLQLYNEGLGGLPINSVGNSVWLPLDGNMNDYSGNGNTGVPTNVIYTHINT